VFARVFYFVNICDVVVVCLVCGQTHRSAPTIYYLFISVGANLCVRPCFYFVCFVNICDVVAYCCGVCGQTHRSAPTILLFLFVLRSVALISL